MPPKHWINVGESEKMMGLKNKSMTAGKESEKPMT